MLTRNHSTPPPELDPIPISDIIGPLQFGVLMNDNAFGTYECAISTTSLCLCLVEARGYNNCFFIMMYICITLYINDWVSRVHVSVSVGECYRAG